MNASLLNVGLTGVSISVTVASFLYARSFKANALKNSVFAAWDNTMEVNKKNIGAGILSIILTPLLVCLWKNKKTAVKNETDAIKTDIAGLGTEGTNPKFKT